MALLPHLTLKFHTMELNIEFVVTVSFTTDGVTTATDYALNHYPSEDEVVAIVKEDILDNARPTGSLIQVSVTKQWKGTV